MRIALVGAIHQKVVPGAVLQRGGGFGHDLLLAIDTAEVLEVRSGGRRGIPLRGGSIGYAPAGQAPVALVLIAKEDAGPATGPFRPYPGLDDAPLPSGVAENVARQLRALMHEVVRAGIALDALARRRGEAPALAKRPAIPAQGMGAVEGVDAQRLHFHVVEEALGLALRVEANRSANAARLYQIEQHVAVKHGLDAWALGLDAEPVPLARGSAHRAGGKHSRSLGSDANQLNS